jgi:dTDP-4-amino-4,6-dideoxygalactose transaminase
MDAIVSICEKYDISLIEDCAHTMGAKWGDTFTSRFGEVGCFSTQTFKHINSGEGGLLVTNDEELAAQAILYTGSYMLYGQHESKPSQAVFDKYKGATPNFSMRMSNLVACLLRPQFREMQQRGETWNRNYRWLEARLNTIDGVSVQEWVANEAFVASSIQFDLAGLNKGQIEQISEQCTARDAAIKWFGRAEPVGYTSLYQHWEYLTPQDLPQTNAILQTTCDMRIPLSLTESDCDTIAQIIKFQLNQLRHA